MGYDAEIRISTKVDTGQMRKLQAQIDKSTYKVDALSKKYKELKDQKVPTEEYKHLQKELSEAQKELEKMFLHSENSTKRLLQCKKDIERLSKLSYEYAKKMAEVGRQKIPTEPYAEVQKKITESENKLESLQQKQERFLKTGGRESSSAYKKMAYDADMLEQKIERLHKNSAIMEKAGIAFTSGKDTEQYSKLAEKHESVNRELEEQKYIHEDITKKQEEATKKVAVLTVKTEKLVKTGKAFTLGKDTDELKKTALNLESEKAHLTQLINKQKDLGHKQVKLSDGLKKIGTSGKKAFRGINIGAKKTGSLFKQLGSRLKGILLSLLIFNWISKGFNLMVSSMKEGFKNLAQYSDAYNRSMSNLMNSGNQLKNNLAAAFEPIANRILPCLTQFIDYLNSAAEAFSRFMAVLSGKSTYTRAVRKNDDYAKSLQGTTDSAKEAAGAVKDTAEEVEKLAAFDNIDVLEKQTNTQSNHTANNNGSNTAIGNPGGSQTYFEEAEVGQVSGWLASLKDAIKNGDWYSVGALLADKVNGILKGIKWEDIKSRAKEIATNIANFLNGGIDNKETWTMLGNTIANGIMTAFIFVGNLIPQMHFAELGKGLATALMRIINGTDWGYVGWVMSECLLQAFRFLYNFINTLQYEDIARAITDGISGFIGEPSRWEVVGRAIGAGLQLVIDIVKELVKTMPWGKIVKACGHILSGLFEEMEPGDIATVLAVVLGAVVVKGIGLISKYAIKKAFTNWIDSILIPAATSSLEGSVSVGTLASGFASTAATIVGGFALALGAAIHGFALGQQLYRAITGEKPEASWVEQLTTTISSFLDGSWKGAFELWKDDIVESFKSFTDGSWKEACKMWGKETLDSMSNDIAKLADNVDDNWNRMTSFVKGCAKGLADNVKDNWHSMTDFVKNCGKGLAESARDNSSRAAGFFEACGNRIGATNSAIFKTMQTGWGKSISRLEGLWNGFFKTIKGTDVLGSVKKPLNAIIECVEALLNNIISGINATTSLLNTLSFKIPEWVPSIGGKNFGFNFAQIDYQNLPRLATGAVFHGGSPYAAIVNDQPRGQTNVETPLDTIVQAFNQALDSRGGTGPVKIEIQATGDKAQLIRYLNLALAEESARRGMSLVVKGV